MFGELDVANDAFCVHGLAGHHLPRRAGAGGTGQLLRRTRVRGERSRRQCTRCVGTPSSRPVRRTGSLRTAPRRCTSYERRRAIRSSGRTPTAPSHRTISAWAGRCPNANPTSSKAFPRKAVQSGPELQTTRRTAAGGRDHPVAGGSQVIDHNPIGRAAGPRADARARHLQLRQR